MTIEARGYDRPMSAADRTRRPFDLAEAVAVLTRTPATLDALLRGLPDGWVQAHEGGDTWSAFDVLGLSWARSVSAMANALRSLATVPVVQLTGALARPGVDDSSIELVREVARVSGGPAYFWSASSGALVSDSTRIVVPAVCPASPGDI